MRDFSAELAPVSPYSEALGLRYLHYFPASNVLYSGIPKNASTQMLNSLLRAEGVSEEDLGFAVHFGVKDPFRVKSSWFPADAASLVAVRDPLDRIVSTYLDKVVLQSEPYFRNMVSAQCQIGDEDLNPQIHGISMEQFVHVVCSSLNSDLDEHLRPQRDFALRLSYTHVVDLSGANNLEFILRHLGLSSETYKGADLHHRRSRLRDEESGTGAGAMSQVKSSAFFRDKTEGGLLPTANDLLSEDLREMLADRFRDDYEWIRDLIGRSETNRPAMVHSGWSKKASEKDGGTSSSWTFGKISDRAQSHSKRFRVSPEIHTHDNLFDYLVRHAGGSDPVDAYFTDGRDCAEILRDLGEHAGVQWGDGPSLLEFASGFGRVTRHFGHVVPSARVTACDIHPEAVEFVSATLGVPTLLSSIVPESLHLSSRFHVIFALSFFSHVAPDMFGRWLARLGQATEENGVLIFTTHGPGSRPAAGLGDFGDVWFGEMSDQPDLDPSVYGTTVVSRSYVEEQLELAGLVAVDYLPAHWWGHQDTYVCRPSASFGAGRQ